MTVESPLNHVPWGSPEANEAIAEQTRDFHRLGILAAFLTVMDTDRQVSTIRFSYLSRLARSEFTLLALQNDNPYLDPNFSAEHPIDLSRPVKKRLSLAKVNTDTGNMIVVDLPQASRIKLDRMGIAFPPTAATSVGNVEIDRANPSNLVYIPEETFTLEQCQAVHYHAHKLTEMGLYPVGFEVVEFDDLL